MSLDVLHSFLTAIENDARISSTHISVYMALWKKFIDNNYEEPVYFFRTELISVSKISGTNVYHRVIRQLHEYGYVRYIPSYNHLLGSIVYLSPLEK